ncbi:hypothetical protein Tco_1092054 [Tanacetum coccineum]|uniref:Uncharacterized protein n=1 Tax=Tanacetum coccineum TaxID=301880 RepID=A0ABQ5I9Z7_9ASTR
MRVSTARHPQGLRRHSPTPHGAAVVAVPSCRRGDANGGEVMELVMVVGLAWQIFWWPGGGDANVGEVRVLCYGMGAWHGVADVSQCVGAEWCFDGGACGGCG